MVEKKNEIATQAEQIELVTPKQILEYATSIKEMIVDNKLYTPIKGKNYVNVEGWQIAGAFIGIMPVVERVDDISQNPNEYKYRAEVSLRNGVGDKVGYGVAICTNREKGKKDDDEYAIASMAQTRAVGKAYRLKIGWLLKVAGYETTPAEEMDTIREAQVTDSKKYSVRDISIAKSRLEHAKDLTELKVTFSTLGDIMNHPEIIAAKDELKKKLSEKQEKVVTATRGGENGME